MPSSEVKALIEDDRCRRRHADRQRRGRDAASPTAAGGVLKKCVLELGGSDAYLVLEDADVAAAAKVCAAARMVNGGQSCIAGKRFIVVREVREAFESAMVEAMRGLRDGRPARCGRPSSARCRASHARDEIHAQVRQSVANGARLLLGGEVPDRPGAWYPATVLADVTPGQPAHDEEVFGPVAAIIDADDEADAIRIANASEFGLGSGVLTGDLARGRADRRRGARSRHELRQRERPLRPAHAVRRRQAFGLRPRVRRPSASASSSTSRACTSVVSAAVVRTALNEPQITPR